MRPYFALAVLAVGSAALAAEPDQNGFRPLFNGKDLSGWAYVNTPEKTFYVKDGEIITTGTPTGFLRTERQYENFVLELDWMHENKKEVGNSGLFVWGDPLPAVGSPYTRGIEVQVLVNLEYKDKKGNVTATSHGDVFAIWGAHCKPDRPHPLGWERCLPSENRAKGGGEWNHYRVEANNGVIKLSVNGKEVSGVSECTPRQGYLALESEGAVCHFKNIRLKELPSTNPKPSDVANVANGFMALFNGLNLEGLKTEAGAWKAGGGHLQAEGTAELRSTSKFRAVELMFDWRLPKGLGEASVSVGGKTVALKPQGGGWSRETIRVEQAAAAEPIVIKPVKGLELMNVFVRESK